MTNLSTSLRAVLIRCANCGEDIETLSDYLLHCPDYVQERIIHMNTVR